MPINSHSRVVQKKCQHSDAHCDTRHEFTHEESMLCRCNVFDRFEPSGDTAETRPIDAAAGRPTDVAVAVAAVPISSHAPSRHTHGRALAVAALGNSAGRQRQRRQRQPPPIRRPKSTIATAQRRSGRPPQTSAFSPPPSPPAPPPPPPAASPLFLKPKSTVRLRASLCGQLRPILPPASHTPGRLFLHCAGAPTHPPLVIGPLAYPFFRPCPAVVGAEPVTSCW